MFSLLGSPFIFVSILVSSISASFVWSDDGNNSLGGSDAYEYWVGQFHAFSICSLSASDDSALSNFFVNPSINSWVVAKSYKESFSGLPSGSSCGTRQMWVFDSRVHEWSITWVSGVMPYSILPYFQFLRVLPWILYWLWYMDPFVWNILYRLLIYLNLTTKFASQVKSFFCPFVNFNISFVNNLTKHFSLILSWKIWIPFRYQYRNYF